MKRRPPKAGAVLAEVLLATVLGALVAGAALDALVRSARFGQEHAARAAARAQLDQGATALTTDLRPLATTAAGDDPADLRTAADTALELLAPTGAAVACAITPALGATTGSTVDLAGPPDAAGTPALAWWTAPPRPGDLALVHDDAGTPTPADDRWVPRTVRLVSDGTTYCRSGPFAAADAGLAAGAPRFRLTLDGPALPATALAGAPVRLARRRRYSLYRAADSWQLGVRDWDGSAWETVQPLAGPFNPPSDPGLRVDAAGAELRVLLRAPCTGRTPARVRCVDSAVAVVRPRGGA